MQLILLLKTSPHMYTLTPLIYLQEETLLDVLELSHQYLLLELESSISDYLKAILNARNVCLIYDMASMYSLKSLCHTCSEFMDRNATDIIKTEAFLSMSPVSTWFIGFVHAVSSYRYIFSHFF